DLTVTGVQTCALPISNVAPNSYFRTGLYPAPRLPYTLGREAAGTVVAAGASSALAVGDRVAYLAEGAYAAHTLVAAARCVRIPEIGRASCRERGEVGV